MYMIGSLYVPSNFRRLDLISGLDKMLNLASIFDGMIVGDDLNSKNPE